MRNFLRSIQYPLFCTGMFCALTLCEMQPCAFGQCKLMPTSYACTCLPSYTGSNCEQKLRPCADNPCEGRGECFEKGDTFLCRCHAWWEGELILIEALLSKAQYVCCMWHFLVD
jgi:hypothetical protein